VLTQIDYLFIGPNDLAQSLLGYTPARGDEPVFVDAIQKIVAAAKKHGKWVGRLVNDGEGAVRELKTFDSVAITGDTKAVTNWYTAQIAQVRG
jgi:4-hydroxy-2-oxoheptanedioate aldolase